MLQREQEDLTAETSPPKVRRQEKRLNAKALKPFIQMS